MKNNETNIQTNPTEHIGHASATETHKKNKFLASFMGLLAAGTMFLHGSNHSAQPVEKEPAVTTIHDTSPPVAEVPTIAAEVPSTLIDPPYNPHIISEEQEGNEYAPEVAYSADTGDIPPKGRGEMIPTPDNHTLPPELNPPHAADTATRGPSPEEYRIPLEEERVAPHAGDTHQN